MKIYCDMDGVLADFDAHHEAIFGMRPDKTADNVNWQAIRDHKDFYLNIPPMADMQVLWDYIAKYDPIVLTGVPYSVPEAPANKIAWVKKNLGDVPVICTQSKKKYLHANEHSLLIDDWPKYKHLWVGQGGHWITHTSAQSTIEDLKGLGL